MKLSKKGKLKFNQYLYEYGTYVSCLRTTAPTPLEFEPSDFKDCIILTGKEAKILLELTKYKQLFTESEVVEIVKLTQQIEQTEKSHE